MRRPSCHRGQLGHMDVPMTPMIDVVFQLIIFFLVSSHLARQETQLALDLPKAATGHRPEESPVRRVVVNVLEESEAEERIQVGGKPLSRDELAALIAFESRRSDEPLEVRIRCDRRVRYRVIEPILIACARARVWNVTFAVVTGD